MELKLDFIRQSVEMLKIAADYYELIGDPRRYGYYRAIESLRAKAKELDSEIEKFTDLYGIGESIGSKLQFFYDSGTFPDFIKELASKLVEDKRSTNPHKHYMTRQDALGVVTDLINFITGKLKCEVHTTGSYRRQNSIVGDMDLLVVTDGRDSVSDDIVDFCKETGIEVTAKGSKKLKLIFKLPDSTDLLECDVRFCDSKELGTMLLYFTGPASFNIRLRQVARNKGLKLSEYGITNLTTGEFKTFDNEADALAELGMDFIAPEER